MPTQIGLETGGIEAVSIIHRLGANELFVHVLLLNGDDYRTRKAATTTGLRGKRIYIRKPRCASRADPSGARAQRDAKDHMLDSPKNK
jgi:hypothetical protein